MSVIQHIAHQRSISENRNNRYSPSPSQEEDRDLFPNKFQREEHEAILKERARRFVARMRKQKQYVGGKHILKKQVEDKRRQQEQKMIKSLIHERQEMQKSIKMSVALQKILSNECKKEKRLVKQFSQQIKTPNYEQQDQEYRRDRNQNQKTSLYRQIPSAKRFKTFVSQRIDNQEQTPNITTLPPITIPNQPKPTQTNTSKHSKPLIPLNKPRQDRQIYLNRLDQMKLKSIDSKMRKLNKLSNQIYNNKT